MDWWQDPVRANCWFQLDGDNILTPTLTPAILYHALPASVGPFSFENFTYLVSRILTNLR